MPRWYSALLLLILALAAGCQGGDSSSTSSAATVEIDGCQRAYDDLLQLDFTPVACTAGCPEGSHCDDDLDQCEFACINHSDCGPSGWTCDCSGTCVAGPTPTTGGDASCPRSLELLAAIKADPVRTTRTDCATGDAACPVTCADDLDCPSWSHCEADTERCAPRTCAFDDECPNGSFCDASIGQCNYACIPGDPAQTCSADQRCDCYGRCVGADEDDAPGIAEFEFSLDRNHLGPQDFEAGPVTIKITARTQHDQFMFDPSWRPALRLEADSGLTINGSTEPVILEQWSFTFEGSMSAPGRPPPPGAYVARATFTVAAGPTYVGSNTYVITARSAVARDVTRRIIVGPGPYVPPLPVADGVYTLNGTYEITGPNLATTATVTGAVAHVRNGKLLGQTWTEQLSSSHEYGYIFALIGSPYLSGAAAISLESGGGMDGQSGLSRTAITPVLTAPGHYSGGLITTRTPTQPELNVALTFELVARPGIALVACALDLDCPVFQSCAPSIASCVDQVHLDARTRVGPQALIDLVDLSGGSAPGTAETHLCDVSIDMESAVQPASGDLLCSDGKPMRAAEILARRDAGGDMEAADVANQCLDRLLHPVATSDECVNPVRFHRALRAWMGWTNGGTQVFQRAVSQWLEVHTFLATQLRTDEGLAEILQDGTASEGSDPATQLTVLDQGLAYGFVAADALLRRQPEGLRFADYRGYPVAYWSFDAADGKPGQARDLLGGHHLALPSSFSVDEHGVWGTGTLTTTVPLGPIGGLAWNGAMPTEVGQKPVWTLTSPSGTLEIGVELALGITPTLYAKRGAAVVHSAYLPAQARSFLLRWVPEWDAFEVYADGAPAGRLDISNAMSTQPTQVTATQVTLSTYGWIEDAAIYSRPPAVQEVGFGYDRLKRKAHLPLLTEDDQAHSAAVALAEYATVYLRFAEHVMDREARVFHQDCHATTSPESQRRALARLRTAIDHARGADVAATDVYFRARTVGCTTDSECSAGATCQLFQRYGEKVCMTGHTMVDAGPVPWQDRWHDARAELQSELVNAERKYQSAVECRNPLGIEEWDLPLYFSDTTGINTSFFAASDYLLERLAVPAVHDTEGRFGTARMAWLNQRNADLQDQQSEQARQIRIEELEVSFGTRLAALCGLHDVPATVVLERFIRGADGRVDLHAKDCFRMQGTNRLRGEVGQQALALESARREVWNARERGTDALERYEAKDRACTELENDNETIEDALAEHQERSAIARRELAMLSLVETAVGGMAAEDPSTGMRVLLGSLKNEIEEGLAQSQAAYDTVYLHRTFKKEEDACWLEAGELRRSIRETIRGVGSAYDNAAAAMMQLREGVGTIEQLIVSAQAQLDRERKRVLPSVAHHYWLDEELDQYQGSFVRAQRYVYIAMLAVEYEFQQSLGLRSEILTADRPAALANVIEVLRAEVAARTINGRRPEASTVVLSLREDVLRLDDGADLPGERAWPSYKRFGSRLMAREYAMYNDEGTYLGQGVPFTFAPTGALAYRCAERLWRVNATVQVDAPGVSTPNIPVMLLKKNTFSSQYCDGHGDGFDQQLTSMRPSAQLISGGGQEVEAEPSAFTASMMHPWLNVPRGEFYQDAYRNGSSEEFAGRGLYGDYVLLFPEEGLLELTDPTRADFPLRRVEDILLRLDLISVDNLDTD